MPHTSNPDLTRQDRTRILRVLKRLVPERHINVNNLNQDYSEWIALLDARTPSLIAITEAGLFETEVNYLLALLGSSHTAFFHQRRQSMPSPYSINATLTAVETSTGRRWMFADVIDGGVAHSAGIRPGELLVAMDGRQITVPDPVTFKMGSRHELELTTFSGNRRQLLLEVPDRTAKGRPPLIEPPAISHRLAAPGIGLIRVAYFPGAVGQTFARELSRVVSDLKDRDVKRLILDLRANIGGGLGVLRLLSYLCPGKKEVGYSLTRQRLRKGYAKEKLPRIDKIPTTKAQLIKMAIRFRVFQRDRSLLLATEGLGSQPFHGRIVVLVNEHTHSAAEMVASFARANMLAMLVGTKTAGEVLGGANFKLPAGYVLRLPVAGWYTWEGECIEGKGVDPDVAAENSPEKLAAGVDDQFDRALSVVQRL